MSNKTDGYVRLYHQTKSQRSDGEDSGPMKDEELLEEEAAAERSKYANTATVVDADCMKTEKGTINRTYFKFSFEGDDDETTEEVVNTKLEMEQQDENDTEANSPSSTAVIFTHNEAAEKNLNFNLIFPYGHDFMLERERALAVLVAKDNNTSDQSQQYENYDEWVSRISKENSLQESVCRQRTSARGHGLQQRDQAFLVSNQITTKTEQACVTDNNIPAKRQNSHESHPRLVVKKPEQLYELRVERSMQMNRNVSDNANKIKDSSDDIISATLVPHSYQTNNKIDRESNSHDIPGSLQHIVADDSRNFDSQPLLVVKKPEQLNESIINKMKQIDHDYCGNADKTQICNVNNINGSQLLHFGQGSNKMDQICTSYKQIPSILQDILTNNTTSRKSRPRLAVKKPEKLNGPTPEKKMRMDHSVCDNADKTKGCNVTNVNTPFNPPSSQSCREIDQVCITDDNISATHLLADSLKSRSEIVIKMPKLRKKPVPKTPKKIMQVDKIGDCNVRYLKGETQLSSKDDFKWSTSNSFRGVRETFEPTQTGSTTFHETIYDAFRAYWDDDILTHIVAETNRFANSPSQSDSFKKQWHDTNIHEILVLFAFWMMLGVIRMPTIKSCFSNDPLLKVNVFRTMFSKSRYDILVSALSFANNDTKPANAGELHGFGPVLHHLCTKFQSNFVPTQSISILDSLLLWKQAVPGHQVHTKQKIRTFELCDNATGYLWSFLIPTEKDEINSTMLKSVAIVLKLIRPLLNKGYTLYMKSLLNSPTLARFLKKNKTDCVGTVSSSSKGFPPSLSTPKPGQTIATHSGDVCVLASHDKKTVLYVSTCHSAKVEVVSDCNKNFSSVDQSNQMLEPYILVMETKRCGRWYVKFFKRMVNCSILNAQILLESSRKKKVDHLATRLQLVDLIMQKHLSLCPVLTKSLPQATKLPPWREGGAGHWPAHSTKLQCAFCSLRGSKKKTAYKCEKCDVPLCILCFKGFHNQSTTP